jgi:ADP-ribose pyrophosphatase YjhB (NUDIX family)
MQPLGVNIAIIKNGTILLTKREDFEIWCLPGGAVDPGESVAQAAIREAREETGLEVELTRLVGVYSRPRWPGPGAHIVLFAARPISSELIPDPNEVIDIAYFSMNEIPEDLLWWNRQRIKDAMDGIGGGVVWSQDSQLPFEGLLTREELYTMRDQSGLSRRDFYFAHIGKMDGAQETLEVRTEEVENGAGKKAAI